MHLSKGNKIVIFVVLLLLIDQIVKIWIKTHMTIGESIPVFGDWFQILFIENRGMAFGMQFGGDIGKLLLSLFRIVFCIVLIIFLRNLIKKDASMGVLIGASLILIGALGNTIDCSFYGVIFNESTYDQVATLFPEGGGYAPFMFGRVVDMLYFPVIEMTLPQWFPIWGGEEFIFFRPIFNVADSCITIGCIYILLFKRSFLTTSLKG
jgi:Lipoprotein signal peptidase